jgi:hypothetical protein
MTTSASPKTAVEARVEAAIAAFADLDAVTTAYRPALPTVASPSYHAVESDSFEVVADGGKTHLFLRLGADEVADLVNENTAFLAATRLADLGFSPSPLGRSIAQRAVFSALLPAPWRVAKIDDLMQDGPISLLIAMQKTIASDVPFGRPWSVFEGIDQLWGLLQAANATLPEDAGWLRRAMAPIREAIAAAGVDLRPAHGDPHSSNVMIGPNGALQLVDFDMAGDIDPYYQLGVQMNELFQFESQMKPLLEMHDGHVSDRAFNRCRLYAAADDLYWALRGSLLETRSPRRSVEFLKYAQWRFLRCRMLVGCPGFEELIRSL